MGIGIKHLMVLASLSSYHETRIVGRRRHKAKDFTSGGLDGNNTSEFVLHQAFAQLLQFEIETERKVLARYRLAVELAILIVSLDASSCVTKQNLDSLLPSQLSLVTAFNALFAYVVATLVIIVGLNVGRTNLTHIA